MTTLRPPAFVLTGSRSGSTLLRVLLDTHPAICAPSETNLGRACAALVRTWQASHPGLASVDIAEPEWAMIRDALAAPLDDLTKQSGKQMWCEKSIDNVWAADVLAGLWPESRFLFLHRHCLDMVYSGLEASRWGFRAYGFEDYVRASPGNTVEALVRCWCDTVEASLRCEQKLPGRVLRCGYESLSSDADAELDRIFTFLGVDADAGVAERAFTTDHQLGSGDHKLPFTSRVESDHTGRGRRIPVQTIGQTLLARMNTLLTALDYPEVSVDWNHTPSSPDREESATTRSEFVTTLTERSILVGPHADHVSAMLYVDDSGISVGLDSAGALCWCAGFVTDGGGAVIETAHALEDIVTGRSNIGYFLREGILRTRTSVSALTAIIVRLQAELDVGVSR